MRRQPTSLGAHETAPVDERHERGDAADQSRGARDGAPTMQDASQKAAGSTLRDAFSRSLCPPERRFISRIRRASSALWKNLAPLTHGEKVL